MEYRRMGKTGLQLSVLSFGSWVSFHKQVDDSVADELMGIAYDNGVNFFDNAAPIAGCQNVPVNFAGQAQCLVSNLGLGNHPITAAYSGAGFFLSKRYRFPSKNSLIKQQTEHRAVWFGGAHLQAAFVQFHDLPRKA